jgi:hypothetical protein
MRRSCSSGSQRCACSRWVGVPRSSSVSSTANTLGLSSQSVDLFFRLSGLGRFASYIHGLRCELHSYAATRADARFLPFHFLAVSLSAPKCGNCYGSPAIYTLIFLRGGFYECNFSRTIFGRWFESGRRPRVGKLWRDWFQRHDNYYDYYSASSRGQRDVEPDFRKCGSKWDHAIHGYGNE